MGCPGEARTKPRRKIAVATLPETSPDGGGDRHNIACGTWPHARRDVRSMAAPCMAQPANHRALHQRTVAGHLRNRLRWPARNVARVAVPTCAAASQAPALEGLKNSIQTESPRRGDRNKSDHVNGGTRRCKAAADWGVWERRDAARDTASHGPTTIVTPKSQFRTCPSDHEGIALVSKICKLVQMCAKMDQLEQLNQLVRKDGSAGEKIKFTAGLVYHLDGSCQLVNKSDVDQLLRQSCIRRSAKTKIQQLMCKASEPAGATKGKMNQLMKKKHTLKQRC
ncbi:ribosome biogenesis protein bms1 [Dorcoceras hygrometricum]|uniref:Ribosome biogenesis protein bms1 n=1 Tax=Dorcoceras hygrometricum TaxID=472368 RepID=A0A2Z7ADR3_9LAMI|nr:ribosome biogenesis protein bms1 [Dorcoceras hygrometricum]